MVITTATDFESQLDDNPSDWTLRSIYADWLEEQGNPRADSQRWMVATANTQMERLIQPDFLVFYPSQRLKWTIHVPVFLKTSLEDHLTGEMYDDSVFCRDYPTRIAAEIDLHNALVKAGEITCALIEEVEA